MPIYANLGRDSNVYSYELGSGWIEVTFKDGVTYGMTIVPSEHPWFSRCSNLREMVTG